MTNLELLISSMELPSGFAIIVYDQQKTKSYINTTIDLPDLPFEEAKKTNVEPIYKIVKSTLDIAPEGQYCIVKGHALFLATVPPAMIIDKNAVIIKVV